MKLKPHPKSRRGGKTKPGKTRRRHHYTLKLYVAGLSRRSITAAQSIKRICEQHLSDRYDLEIVDLYRNPKRAGREQIIAAPTLVKSMPLPLRRMIGDMVDEARVLIGLDLVENK